MFGNKTTYSGDLVQVKSLREYATKDRDGFSLWNPYIFCGMPAVATSMSLRWFDLTASVYSYTTKVYSSFFRDYNAIYTFSFVILAFTSFFFMRRFGASRSVSFLVATATIFSTGILLFFYIGHITKLMSLALFPFILMMLFKFQKEIKLFDLFLFVFGLHILVLGAHVQIVFYFAFTTMIYFIYFFIRSFVIKDKFLQKQLLKSLGVVTAAGLIALLMSFDTYSQLYEYKPYSTRGTKSLTEEQTPGSPIQSESYEYATNWSFSPGEVLTFIVPSFYGFGNSIYNGPLSQNQDAPVNTYFGQMRSVDVPMYMGVIIFALGLFTLFVRWKEPVIQFFGIIVLLFLLISFGNNFPVIYNLMYHYFPVFNSFRAPSMILTVLQITFPILAGLGVMKIISLRDEKNPKLEKVLRNAAIFFAGLFVLSIILGGSLGSWFTQRVNDHAALIGQSQQSQMFTALTEYMSDMFKSDLMIALALLALTAGISYAYVTSKLNKELFVFGLTVMILFDLFRIGTRGASYVEAEQIKELFREPEYISVIKKQNEKNPFRILNMKRDGMGTAGNNANYNVYFLQEDLSGYSAVKPRSYQDIIDAVTPANFTLWRMLGVKYVVTDKPFPFEYFTTIAMSPDSTTFVNRNDMSLPRVYFVDSVAQKSSVEILNAIKENSFNPNKLAFVNSLDFKFDKGDSTNTARISEYKDERISAETKSQGNCFLFFGTTYLPGWKAFVDGAETTIHKTNHGFMGIVVPKGEHKVEFVYEPKNFVLGKYLSLLLNLLMFGGLVFTFFLSRKKKAAEKKKA
ncbi:MAG: YfhO family protein, partial [Bacteroidota bacterium]